jgi:ketosteroid isomerase-like protein
VRTADDNKALIEQFWVDLYRRDFDAVGAYFAPDGQYTDVFTPDDDVAVGPEMVAARLRLGLEPLEDIRHHPKAVLADDHMVMTEHAEEWHWGSGEEFTVRFVSVHEIDAEGRITRWWDYPDLQGLLAAAPQWWLDHIFEGYQGQG